MRLHRTIAIAAAIVAFGASTVWAQGDVTSEQTRAIEAAIRTALVSEQVVFESKDCEAAVALFTVRDPLIYVDGRFVPDPDVRTMACGIMEAASGVTARTLRSQSINVLSATSAYSVSRYDLQLANDRSSSLTVTRIWQNVRGEWLIVHLQQSGGL